MNLKGLLVILLLGLVLGGCSARAIHFDSHPRGAEVIAGAKRCTTPCTLKVACDVPLVLFTDSAGREKTAEVPPCDTLDNLAHETNNVAGYTLKVAAMPFAAVAFVSYLVFISGEDDPDDLSVHEEAGLLTIASGGVALALFYSGEFFHYLNRREEPPKVLVDFDAGEGSEYHGPPRAAPPEKKDPLMPDDEDFKRLFD